MSIARRVPRPIIEMAPMLMALMTMALLLAGCLGSAPNANRYPAYYQHWQTVPDSIRTDLDAARQSVLEDPEDPGHLHTYARATARLAATHADLWLQLAQAPGGASDMRTLATRRKLLEAGQHSLSLFRQIQFSGEHLEARTRMRMAWLMVLVGADIEARELLAALAEDPDLSHPDRDRVEQILEQLADLPPEGP